MTADVIRAVRSSAVVWCLALAAAVALFDVVTPGQPRAYAATAPVDLGAAAGFGVLGATTVTNAGETVVATDVGVSPGTAVTGFPPGTTSGTIHPGNAVASAAHTDLATAYADATGRAPDTIITGDIGGTTLTPGVYNAAASVGISGTLTLDGGGDPNAVFIIQAGSTLITEPASMVTLTNGAQACNVFWQVGSSATLGAASAFSGTVLAMTSITVSPAANVTGRVMAVNGAVTLDTNIINGADCAPGELSISAPAATGLGSGTPGTTITNTFGSVAVDDQRGTNPAAWTATVTCTDFTTPGAPSIPASAVTYTAGDPDSQIGDGTFNAGPPGTVSLTPRTAYSHTGGTGTSLLVWSPTLSVAVPPTAVAAEYTGTVTHSVA